MATANWFNYDFYMNAKLAQMVASDPTGDWTLLKLVQTFGTAGFVGPEGGQAHFEGFGQNEGLSPNEFFNPQEYYSAKAAEFYNKAPSAVTPLDAANIELLIKNAGMNAWSHYTAFGSAEGVNPSNSFDSSKYMDAKLATMKTADPTGAWDMPKLVKAFQDAGLSALEHFMTFGGTGPGEVAQKYDPAKPSIPAEFAVPESEKVNAGGGETFTLTKGVDNIVGTSGNDTILAVAATTDATMSVADQINGGAGTDTLKLTIDTLAANSVPATNTTGVEVIEVRNISGNAQTINGTNFIGNTSFVNNISANQLDLVNVKTSTVTVQGNNAVTLGATNIAVSGSIGNSTVAATDSVTQAFTLNIAGGTKGTANIYVDDTNADWTAATINSTGAANTVGVVNLSGLQATAATHTIKDLTINATTNLAIGTAGGAAGLTGFATGASVTNTITVKGAAASVVLNTVAAAVDVIDASGLTAGGVTADISSTTNEAKFKFTGGAGNDTVITDAGLTDSAAFIDGGDGVDTLALKTGQSVAAQAARLKNFETLRLDGAIAQDVSLLTASAIDKIVFNAANSSVSNLSVAQAANVWVQATPTNLSVGVKGAETVSQIDTVKVTVDDGVAGVLAIGSAIALGTPVLAGVENLELTANDSTSITTLTSASALNNIILKGAGDISLTSGAITPQSNTTIDGSAATGALTIDLSGIVGTSVTNAVAITGGTKADTITASGGAADVINGKGGLDIITVTKDGANSGFAKVVTEVTNGADADHITGFVTTENKFVLKNGLVNGSGTSADGTVTAEVVSATTFAAGLADVQAGNKTVFIATTDLAAGNGNAELATLATSANFTAANQAALIAKLVGIDGALNGTIANLDTVLGASDAVLLVLDDGTNSVALRITNTDTTAANTLTADEIQVVGVFAGTAALAAADFA